MRTNQNTKGSQMNVRNPNPDGDGVCHECLNTKGAGDLYALTFAGRDHRTTLCATCVSELSRLLSLSGLLDAWDGSMSNRGYIDSTENPIETYDDERE